MIKKKKSKYSKVRYVGRAKPKKIAGRDLAPRLHFK